MSPFEQTPVIPVIQLNRVGRHYGNDPPVHALIDVDLQVTPGEWLAITGPSGAGKSTLLNVLGCLDRPTSGSYLLDGIDTAKLNDSQRAGLRSRRIGFVFQAFHLLAFLRWLALWPHPIRMRLCLLWPYRE